MIEVEAKVKIRNKAELERIRARARTLSKSYKKLKKIDFYYTLEKSHYPKKSIRIRKINHLYQINFKQKLFYIKGIHAKKEHEFTTSNVIDFIDLIKDFGFKKWLTKIKFSEIYEINNHFHIEINFVKHIGYFVEIEYLVDNKKEIEKARKEILKVLKTLGIKNKIIKDGYTKLLWNKGFKYNKN